MHVKWFIMKYVWKLVEYYLGIFKYITCEKNWDVKNSDVLFRTFNFPTFFLDWWKTVTRLHGVEDEGVHLKQRFEDDQSRFWVYVFVYLTVVRRARTEHSWQGSILSWWSQEMGKESRKSEGALCKPRGSKLVANSVQGAHARWHGVTRVHLKV